MTVSEKICSKTLGQDVFDRRRSLDGVKTLIKISVRDRSLTLLIFTMVWALCGKSYCCNDTFTDVQFTSLLARNSYEEYKLFFMPLESAFQ